VFIFGYEIGLLYPARERRGGGGEREDQHTMLFLFNRAGRENHWFDRKMSKNHEFGLSCALDAYVCVPSPKCCVTGRHASVLKHVTFFLCLSSMGFSLLVHGFCLSGWWWWWLGIHCCLFTVLLRLFQLVDKPLKNTRAKRRKEEKRENK